LGLLRSSYASWGKEKVEGGGGSILRPSALSAAFGRRDKREKRLSKKKKGKGVKGGSGEKDDTIFLVLYGVELCLTTLGRPNWLKLKNKESQKKQLESGSGQEGRKHNEVETEGHRGQSEPRSKYPELQVSRLFKGKIIDSKMDKVGSGK